MTADGATGTAHSGMDRLFFIDIGRFGLSSRARAGKLGAP
jgi:hypothetical protein